MNLRWQLFRFSSKLKGIDIAEELRKTHEINFGKVPFDKIGVFKNLIDNITSWVGYYRGFEGEYNIEKYPVVNKNIIRENYELFSSSKYNINKLKKVTTSGSTGIPFEVRWNKEKVIRNNIDTIFYGKFVNYEPGKPLVFMRVWNELNKLSWFTRQKTNIFPVDISRIDNKTKNTLIRQLTSVPKDSVILAYGSTYQELARILQDERVSCFENISGTWVMSEPVDPETKKILKGAFNSPVLTRYSNSENGFIAQQVDDTGAYLINKASYIVEILHTDSDDPVPYGTVGRVVITDLYNFANPFIRYDTGDLAIKECNGEIELLSQIVGRKLDSIRVNELWISPHSIDYALRSTQGLNQFQLVVRVDNNYVIRLNVDSNYVKPDAEFLVKKRLSKILGHDAIIEFEYVTEIPLLASNKRKIVINEVNVE